MFDLVKITLLVAYIIFAGKWLNKNNCSPVLKFIFWLVLGRLALAAFHKYTYLQSIGPFSIMSLYSIFMVGSSFYYLVKNKQSIIINKKFILIKLTVLLMCISALLNSAVMGSLPSIIKWIFLLQFSLLLIFSINRNGANKVFQTLLLAYSYPIILLLLSVVLGESKVSESDGSTSYIGGYFHESVFSVIVFTGAVLCFSSKLYDHRKSYKSIMLIVFLFIVFLSIINYRTTLIAATFTFMFVVYGQYKQQQYVSKIIYIFLAMGLVFILSISDLSAVKERFVEIPTVIMNASQLIDYPEYYTKEDRKFFSGRVYMWSHYIAEALGGSSLQFFVGQSMDSWKNIFLKYAHNTFISFFYELGIIGVGLLLAIFISIYKEIKRIKPKINKLYSLGFFSSFVFLNLGTMPIWQMEGIIFFSILISITYHASRDSNAIK